MRLRPLLAALGQRKRRKYLCLAIAIVLALVWGGPFAWTSYHMGAARQALDRRDAQSAIAHLRHAGRVDPDDAERHFLLSRAYRRLGRTDDMAAHLTRAEALGYDREALRREQWLIQAQAGDLRQAERHLPALLKDPRGDATEICEVFVDAYFANYQFDKAFGLLRSWQADFPDDPQPHVFRGLYHEHLGGAREAAAAYRQALERAPERLDVREKLARQLVKLHDYAAAAEEFRVCLEERPADADLRCGWGECLVAMGEPDEARQQFERVLATHPGHFAARLALARLDHTAGRVDVALPQLEDLSAERPTDPEVRYLLAQALQSAGQSEAAKEHFQFVAEARQQMANIQGWQQQIQAYPYDAELRYRIGVTLLKYDVPEHGAAWLRSALQIDPHHQPTHTALADYYTATGKQPLAEHHRRLASGRGAES